MAPKTKRVAFLFPGQGSQKVGMGRDWYDQTEIGRRIFDEADSILGFHLSRTCFEGPEEDLKRTENAQPALFVCSVIAYEGLKQAGVEPAVVAGHSLGEYSALYAAGVFDLATGLELVRTRGSAMSEAADAAPGAMAAVLGLDAQKTDLACKEAAQEGGIVGVANYNSPAQTVISGEREAVERAAEKAKRAGARRVVMLPVHGAFHSPLMKPALERMETALAKADLSRPTVPFLANTEGDFVGEPEAIRRCLVRQIVEPVRWTSIMEKIGAMEIDAVVESGPGRVLCGLWRQGGSEIPAHPCGTLEQARAFVEQLRT